MSGFDWGTLASAARRGETPLVHWGSGPTSVALHGLQPVYLASPYSKEAVDHRGVWKFQQSARLVQDAGLEIGRLKAMGVTAISPIVLSGTITHAGRHSDGWLRQHDPLDAVTWMQWCQPLLDVCKAIVVPDLAGWSRSTGIKAEVQCFVDWRLPVFLYATGGDEIGF